MSKNCQLYSSVYRESSLTKLKEINVKELIGRESIHYTNQITDYLSNKIVLITGAGGSIGSELVKQVARVKPKSLILIGRGENSIFNVETMIKKEFPQIEVSFFIADIQDKYLMQRIFKMHKPEVVFHAAAHKHVPLMENNVEAAICNNVFGTRNVVELSSKYGVERFVFISTDKAVHPVNIMGMTKRLGELITLNGAGESSTKFAIVRFGNVIESRGSVIPILKKQIESGGPVTVTHPEMVRYFMTIPEAVHLVLEAGALSKGGEIFVLKMGKPIKIVELAENLIQLYGYTPYKDIEIKFTGIRPGEKLYEVLFYDSENIRTTNHPNIVIAEPLYKIDNLNLKELEDVSKLKREEIKELLLQTINKNI
ncbi:polysaccharide biosynthesis protein [Priestia megaterium]|uniref:UDP-N-acetylglucosamine 4,6-dehydratase family protein n=1 Tax=Priestia megaterium TaxID=1404 RepID=UPI0021D681A6|nr:polysaccharide biosynthesis protein [Priestia megaterium]MCU7712580.1 polysaccharide biosynthesis protein [Priestia megaterium]